MIVSRYKASIGNPRAYAVAFAPNMKALPPPAPGYGYWEEDKEFAEVPAALIVEINRNGYAIVWP